jgi:hypothetical protein
MAAEVKIGRNATFKIESTTVLYLNKITIDDTSDPITGEVFGDSNQKVFGLGTRKVSGSISGFLTVDDTTGQDVMYDAYVAGTAVSGARVYIDDTLYWAPTGTDSQDGFWITSWSQDFDQTATTPVPLTVAFTIGGSWARSDE